MKRRDKARKGEGKWKRTRLCTEVAEDHPDTNKKKEDHPPQMGRKSHQKKLLGSSVKTETARKGSEVKIFAARGDLRWDRWSTYAGGKGEVR